MSAPTFSTVDISSNNSIKTNYAGADDVVSINITASASINQPYVVFQSGGAAITNSPSYSGSAAQWTASYTVSSSDTDGAVSFTIDASNANGSVQTTSTTNSTSVTKVGTTTITTTTSTPQGIIGSIIEGENANDYSGYSVSLSSDGTILAIGAHLNDGNGNDSGHVRVYQYSSSDVSWNQLGSDIDGEASSDHSGISVSLNDDGTIVAIGARYNDTNVNNTGHVRVYQYDATKTTADTNQSSSTFGPIGWNRLGADIDGEALGDYSGESVSLNSDTSSNIIVAIAALGNDANGSSSGHVRVYQYDATKTSADTNQSSSTFGPIGWNRLGGDIDGEAADDDSGFSVSLSSDGTIVAIGAPYNGGNGSYSGHVRVYQYDASKTTAVTDQSSNTFGPAGWNRLGEDIDGELAIEWSGYSVSLSSDGSIVAIGAILNDANGSNAGHVRVYQYDASKTTAVTDQSSNTFGPIGWNRLGDDIDGELVNDNSGRSVSLNSDTSSNIIVAIGANGNDGNGNESGHVRVYQYDATKTTAVTDQDSADFGPIGWNRVGEDIDGETASSSFGSYVSLNSDGTIVAGGAFRYNSSTGYTGIYNTGVLQTNTSTYIAVPPDLTALTIASNNADTTLAKASDNVTLSLTYDMSINTPIIDISSGGAAIADTTITYATVNDSSLNWTATYTVDSADTDGTVTFSIDASSVQTFTSATQATQSDITSGSNVTIDTSIPTLTLVDLSSNNANSSAAKENDVITLNITASETINTPNVAVSVGGSAVSNTAVSGSGNTFATTYTVGSGDNGSVTFTIDASDNAGNSATQVTATTNSSSVNVYTTAPTFSSTVLSSDNSNVTITFSESVYNATGGSGDIEISDFTVSITGGAATNPSFTAITKNSQSVYDLSLSFSNTADGSETLTIVPASATSIYDAAGNAASTSQSNNTASINDKLTPSFTLVDLSSNNSIKTNYAGADDVVSLNITASESINQPYVVFQSGGVAITNSPSYSGSGTQWTASYTVSSSDTNGAVSFIIDASDNDGNTSQRTTTTNSTSVTKVGTTTITTTTSTPQGIIGSIIEGEASSDRSGYSVSLSSDGTIVAIGAYANDANGSDSGHVRVYQYDATKTTAVTDQSSNTFGPIGWNRLGEDIDGEASGDQSGYSVSLSSDGTIVAIGAYTNDGNGTWSGHVRVYQYDATKTSADTNQSSSTFGPIGWNRLGADIDGENGSDYSGGSVSLSSDGTIVAIGAWGNDGNGSGSGHVRVYQYDATKTTADTNQSSSTFGPIGWNRLGSDIDGESAGDNSGRSVSLSSDGTIVAIGANGNDGNGNNSGHVRVYQYDATKTTAVTDQSSNTFGPIGWNRLGSDIDGEATIDYSGVSVSLSSDGTIVAIGSRNNSNYKGHVRVYQYDATKTSAVTDQSSNTFGPIGWNRLGEDIDGEAEGDNSGTSVSLSSDGTIVAIGAYQNDANGDRSGHVRVYQYDATKTTAVTDQSSNTFGPIGWNRLGDDIDGEAASNYFGTSVSLNSDGTIVAGGAYNYNSGTGYTGIYNTGLVLTNTSTYNAVPPDLTSLSISSDYTVTTQAKATNEVTLTFAYDMSINTPVIDISSGGAAIADTTITYATVNDSSLNWTAAYTVDSADTLGAVTFAIDASSTQTATNATQVTQADITDGTSMTILESIDPTISSTTLDSFNSNITVTFSESVYANTNGTGDLTTSDFTISVSGGQATSPTLTAISKTSQSIWDLSLSYTGAANGSEQITLNPASTSIYDANANLASTSQSNNTFNLNDIPVISSVVVNKDTGALNTNVTVTFTESVYNTNGGSGDLELSDFTAALSGGVATTPVLSSLTKTSQSVWDMSLSYTGEPAGTETLTINPVSNSIFNASGVEVRNPQSNNTSQLYERWITTDSANYFKNSYVEGFVDVSGSTIRTRGPTDHLLIAGDSSLNNDVTLSSSGMGIGIGDHNNAVDVSGNVDLSGNLFVTGDVSLNDALYVNALSVTGTASYVSTTLNSTNITYNSEVKTTAQVTINESDMSHNNTSQTIHGDLNSSGTFSSDVNLNPAMKLPGNILVVENPNGDYNYGAYTIYSDAYNSKYFAVGKSASHVFNIVNENNAGVYMDNGSTSFTGTSDARLKKNIEPLEDSTDKIDKLNPCTFQWKTQEDDDKRHLGFIAQEVEEVLPELVDENTLLDGSSYKGVKMDDMIPYLLQYVKKLRQKVNSMKKGDNVSISTNGGTVTPFNSESSLDKLDKN